MQADPNPPPGAPADFPIRGVAPSGIPLVYAPPYTRGHTRNLIDRGIGIKIRKPRAWIDSDGNGQIWDENWERRFPFWDQSFAGLFELFEVGLESKLQWSISMRDYVSSSSSSSSSSSTSSRPSRSPSPTPKYSDFILTYPSQGMPSNQPITPDQMLWLRHLTLPNPPSGTDPPLGFLLFAQILKATEFHPTIILQTDPENFGPIGDKVTILLPEWHTIDPNGPLGARVDDPDLLQIKRGGHRYIPTNPSLYYQTEQRFGFEWRTRLAMTGPEHGIQCDDPNHATDKIKYDNLWFVQLHENEMPTFHFWADPSDEPIINSQMVQMRARLDAATATATPATGGSNPFQIPAPAPAPAPVLMPNTTPPTHHHPRPRHRQGRHPHNHNPNHRDGNQTTTSTNTNTTTNTNIISLRNRNVPRIL